jgi:hypothetical protein
VWEVDGGRLSGAQKGFGTSGREGPRMWVRESFRGSLLVEDAAPNLHARIKGAMVLRFYAAHIDRILFRSVCRQVLCWFTVAMEVRHGFSHWLRLCWKRTS